MKTDEYWMIEAIELAKNNVSVGGGPFACIIVKDGEEVGRGVNRVVPNNDPTAHAEVQAIRDACKRLGTHQLTGCTLYTSCEPCPMCFGAIYWARPSCVVYAATKDDAARADFDDAFIYHELNVREQYERNIPFFKLPIPNALDPFTAWKETTNRDLY